MIPARWVDAPSALPPLGDGAVAWLFRDADPAVARFAARAAATGDDLRDAARARAGGGAPRLLRRRVLRVLAAQALGRHPAEPAFARDAAGAVRIGGGELFVGTAGRAGWSAVALAPFAVGVDLEETDALPAAELRAWLAREAGAKLAGRGLIEADASDPRARLSFRRDGPVTACVAWEGASALPARAAGRGGRLRSALAPLASAVIRAGAQRRAATQEGRACTRSLVPDGCRGPG